MTAPVFDADDPRTVGAVAGLLRSGLVVGVPTDTVYGLAVDPTCAGATDRVFALKGRPDQLPLPVLVAGWDQVEAVAGELEAAAGHWAAQHWPGPLTLVVPRHRRFTADLGGGPASRWTVGVRWPAHPFIEALCRHLGPLAVTSANPHGEPPARRVELVAALDVAGDGSLAAVVDGGACDGVPSTVVECRGPASRCLREGAIRWHDPSEAGRTAARLTLDPDVRDNEGVMELRDPEQSVIIED